MTWVAWTMEDVYATHSVLIDKTLKSRTTSLDECTGYSCDFKWFVHEQAAGDATHLTLSNARRGCENAAARSRGL